MNRSGTDLLSDSVLEYLIALYISVNRACSVLLILFTVSYAQAQLAPADERASPPLPMRGYMPRTL